MKKNLHTLLACALIFILGMGIPLIIGVLAFGTRGMMDEMAITTNICMGLLGTPIILYITKRYYQSYYPEKLSELNLVQPDWLKKILFGIIAMGALLLCYIGISLVLGGNMQVNPPLTVLDILSGVATFIGMATLEECLFRGILRLNFSRYGLMASAAIPSLLFVVAHTELWMSLQLFYAAQIFLVGIIFFFILMITKSMWSVIICHALYNISEAIIFGIDTESGILQTNLPETVFGLSGSTIIQTLYIIVQIIIIFILYTIYKKKNVTMVAA